MLQITPIQTKEEQALICADCGVTYNPDSLAYKMSVNGNLAGVCQFRIIDDCAYIYDLSAADGADDTGALVIMGKTALNFIDLCGIKRVFITPGETHNAHKELGFSKDDEGRWQLLLEGYFDKCCGKMKVIVEDKDIH